MGGRVPKRLRAGPRGVYLMRKVSFEGDLRNFDEDFKGWVMIEFINLNINPDLSIFYKKRVHVTIEELPDTKVPESPHVLEMVKV